MFASVAVLFSQRGKERNRDGNKERNKGKMTARKKWSRGEKGNKREKNFRVFHGDK